MCIALNYVYCLGLVRDWFEFPPKLVRGLALVSVDAVATQDLEIYNTKKESLDFIEALFSFALALTI